MLYAFQCLHQSCFRTGNVDADKLFPRLASIHRSAVHHNLGFVQQTVGQRVGIEARRAYVYPHKVCAFELGHGKLWQMLAKEGLQGDVIGMEICFQSLP